MRFLAPTALALAALAGPLVALYMLRSKRRERRVASVMLWESVEEEVSAAVPWKPLRFTWLLLLQLLILALFVFSIARPFVSEATVLGPHTVFVIDTSGSMAMAGRLERAKTVALDLAEDVSESNLASVVEAGPVPRVLEAFSADPEAIADAIESLEAGGGVEDLSGAIGLARGLAAPDRETRVVIFSDGGTASLPEEPVVGAEHLVFDDFGPNLAISGFDAEPSAEGAVRVFLQVENMAPSDQTAVVELEADGLPVGSVELEVPGDGSARDVVPVTAGPGTVLTARLAGEPDSLPLDDRADLVIGGGATLTVGVQGAGSPFLDALIDVVPGVTAAGGEESDILVVDGGPLPAIDRPAWIIRTETAPEGLQLMGLEENLAVTFSRPGDPVLDGVDLSEVVVGQAQVVETVSWLPLVSSGSTPLILLGEVDGHRVVYSTFDLVHSNLPVQVAFPILGANLFQWLGGGESGTVSMEPAGSPIQLITPTGTRARITLPDGEVRQLPADAGSFVDTHLPGVYRVDYVYEEGEVTPGEVAVRRFVPSESAGRSRDIAVGAAPGGGQEAGFLVRELAPWVVAATLVMITLEWWIAHQRPGWRRRTEGVAT